MISLIYAGNSFAFDGILISLLSLIKHNKDVLDVSILTMDLTDVDKNYIAIDERQRAYLERICRSANTESCVKIVDVGNLYRENLMLSPNSKTSYTPYTFLRLFADEIPSLPDKVLYLDADTMINGDLSSLLGTDIEDYELAGALDYYGHVFFSKDYLNAGVLYFNLKKIRETGLFKKCIDAINEKKLYLPDQNALNKYATKKLILPRIYNEQMKFRKENIIQHFVKTTVWFPFVHVRNIRPWNPELVKKKLTHMFDDVLDEYVLLKRTFDDEANDK